MTKSHRILWTNWPMLVEVGSNRGHVFTQVDNAYTAVSKRANKLDCCEDNMLFILMILSLNHSSE